MCVSLNVIRCKINLHLQWVSRQNQIKKERKKDHPHNNVDFVGIFSPSPTYDNKTIKFMLTQGREFLDELSDYQLPKTSSAP